MIRLTLLLALAALPAQAFTASNDLRVQPTGDSTFSVPMRFNPDLTAFWCAAGDYTIRALGKPAETRIWRASPSPRHSGQGIDFSLIAVTGAKTGFVPIFADHGSLSAALAQSFCGVTDHN